MAEINDSIRFSPVDRTFNREKIEQQLKDDSSDERIRKKALAFNRKENSKARIERNRSRPPVGKKLSELVKRAKVSKELNSLKKIKEAQLKTKPKSLLNQRKALIQATNLKTPNQTNISRILLRYGLKTLPTVGILLSALSSKPAGKGSSLDGK